MPFLQLADIFIIQPLKKIRDMAFGSAYDLEEIKSAMEKNEELYNTGKISKEEYEERKSRLMPKLEIAERFTEAMEEPTKLYVAGKITREDFDERKSDIIDKLDKATRAKKGKRRYRIRR